MKPTDLEKPFTLSRDFWLAAVLLGIPVLCYAQPWSWNLPLISRLAGLVFLPFAAAIVGYCPFLFVHAVIKGSSVERRIARALVAALAGAALFLAILWYFSGFSADLQLFGGIAVVLANVLFHVVHEHRAGRSLTSRR